jgi:transposase InsO family protein
VHRGTPAEGGPLPPREGVAARGRVGGANGEPLEFAAAGESAGLASGSDEGIDPERPNLTARRRARRSQANRVLAKKDLAERAAFTPEQRLLILDAWRRSKLPAKDFGALVGVSKETLYGWQKRFEKEGPAGLEDKPRGGPKGSRLSEATRRAILMMKESHPEWGTERLHHLLLRTQGLFASPGAIAALLKEEGYEAPAPRAEPHEESVRHFERAAPNQLWQSDLFTFVLKRQNRRVYVVVFMDDHSRFVVGYGLGASASGGLVRETFEAAIASYGAPEEVLTDNGAQYVTWRGKSEFARLCEKRGIRHIVARPRHPQTLGKTERFWGTLWRECLEAAIFLDLGDARLRIGHFVDAYNFTRPHQGIDGLVPADRFFRAAPEVLATLKARVAKNAFDLARHGLPRKDFYLTGRVGDVGISLHAEGEQVFLTREDGTKEAVDLRATGRRASPGEPQALPAPLAAFGLPPDVAGAEDDEPAEPPGVSPLPEALDRLEAGLAGEPGAEGGGDDAAEGSVP